MGFRETSPGVYFPTEKMVGIDRAQSRLVVERAGQTALKRARLCMHGDPEDTLHEMLICLDKATYVRPHQHTQPESIHIVSGSCDLVMFDRSGRIDACIPLGEYGSGAVFLQRIAPSACHTLIVRSDRLVFHETTLGPFRRSHTDYAGWAPQDGDAEAVRAFRERLEAGVLDLVRRAGTADDAAGRSGGT